MQTQNLDDGDAEIELHCKICTEMFVKAVTLPCSHTFCKYCIIQWQIYQAVCPICRSEITTHIPTVAVDNFIEKILEGASEEVKQHRRELLAKREAALASLAPSTASKSPSTAQEPVEFVSSENNNSEGHDDTDDNDMDDSGSDWEEDYYNNKWDC